MTDATAIETPGGWDFDLTLDRARQVRRWRSEEHGTWRVVAHRADETWGTASGGNQLFGQDLCEASAHMLGENPNAEPWN